jgi:hypothetical protein
MFLIFTALFSLMTFANDKCLDVSAHGLRLPDGSLELTNVRCQRVTQGEWWHFSDKSELDGICKLFNYHKKAIYSASKHGYSAAETIEVNSQGKIVNIIPLEQTRGLNMWTKVTCKTNKFDKPSKNFKRSEQNADGSVTLYDISFSPYPISAASSIYGVCAHFGFYKVKNEYAEQTFKQVYGPASVLNEQGKYASLHVLPDHTPRGGFQWAVQDITCF